MKLKKFGALLLTGVLAITSLTTSAFAAKREKRSADDIDFAAVLEDVSAKGTVNVYHWWTAGGENEVERHSGRRWRRHGHEGQGASAGGQES